MPRTPGTIGRILNAIKKYASLEELTLEQTESHNNSVTAFLDAIEKTTSFLGNALKEISKDYVKIGDARTKGRTLLDRAGVTRGNSLTDEEKSQIRKAVSEKRLALIQEKISQTNQLSQLPSLDQHADAQSIRKGIQDHKDPLLANALDLDENNENLIANTQATVLKTSVNTQREKLIKKLQETISSKSALNHLKDSTLWDENGDLEHNQVKIFLQKSNYYGVGNHHLTDAELASIGKTLQNRLHDLLAQQIESYFKNIQFPPGNLEQVKLYQINGDYNLANVRAFIKSILNTQDSDIGLTDDNNQNKHLINDADAKEFAKKIETHYLNTLSKSIEKQPLDILVAFKDIFENNGEINPSTVRKTMKAQEAKIGEIGLTQNDHGEHNDDKIALSDDQAKQIGKYVKDALVNKLIDQIKGLDETSLEEQGLLHDNLSTSLQKENDDAETAKKVRVFLAKHSASFNISDLGDDKYFDANGANPKFLSDADALKIREAILLKRAELIQSKIFNREFSSVSGVLEKNKINKADKTLEEGLDLLTKATEEKSKNDHSSLLNITKETTDTLGNKKTTLINDGSANIQAFKQISKELKKKEANKYELYLTICDDYVDPSRTSLSPDQTHLTKIQQGLTTVITDLSLYHENLKRQIEIAERTQSQQGELTYDEVKKLSDDNDLADRIIKIHDNLASYKERLNKATNLIANAKTILANTNSMMLNEEQKLGIGRKELELITEHAEIKTVQQEVTKYLTGGASANSNTGRVQAEAAAQKHVTEQKCSAIKVECRTEKGTLIKTAAVRTHEANTTAKVDIMMESPETKLLENESRQGKFSTKPSIPSANAMFLAERYLDVLLPMMKPNATVTITQGNLPNVLIEAIIIACKARSPQINYNAPAGYADKVSDRQVSHYKDINSNTIKKQARPFGTAPDYKNVGRTLPVDIDSFKESELFSTIEKMSPK